MDAVSPTIFFIDGSRNTGLQSQIRETTVSAILSGGVLPGARMPSTRRLADYLKISRLTVTLAYQELVSQGYLEVRSRSAYHVATTPPISRPDRDFLRHLTLPSIGLPRCGPASILPRPFVSRSIGDGIATRFFMARWIRPCSISPHGAIAPGARCHEKTLSSWQAISPLLTMWNSSIISVHVRCQAGEYVPAG